MIIWLASYPKSGNTWIRIFLNALLFSKNKTDIDINFNLIDQFPLRKDFKNLTNNINDINEFSKNCIPAQEFLNLDNKIKIFKTHNAFWKQNKTNYSFTNEENTLGVIYIVRDPRNVITSILNYFNKNNYDEALDFISNKFEVLGGSENEFGVPTIISSWANHYKSWKKFKKNYLLIKYENLIENPQEEFFKITNYLSSIGNYKFDENKIFEIIDNTIFDKLSSQEKIKGYTANSPSNKKLNKKFFNLGPNNNWKNLLDTQTKYKIEKIFCNEMKELKYL